MAFAINTSLHRRARWDGRPFRALRTEPGLLAGRLLRWQSKTTPLAAAMKKAPPGESQIGPCRAPRPRVGAPSRPESRRYTPLVDTSDEFTEFRIVIRVRPFFSARSEGQEQRAGRCGALCLMTYLKHHARISDGDCSPWRIVEALCASQP